MTSKVTKKVRPKEAEKYEYAYLLFMQNLPQNEICRRVGTSNPTLNTWKVSGNWEEKRASRTISLDDLMQKSPRRINDLLDEEDHFNADAFAKAVKQLKTLKSSNTVDDDINTFMSFQDYLIQQRSNHKEITDEFIKLVTRLQDMYVQFRLGNGKLPGK